MIESLISLKIVLILCLGFFILDEAFFCLQTLEATNFFSSRARVVGEDFSGTDSVFQHSIQDRMIFTNNNPFFSIHPLQTHLNPATGELITQLDISSFVETFDSIEIRTNTPVVEKR